MSSALVFQTAAALSDQLAARKVSAVELAQTCLAQVRATDDRIHAFLSVDEPDILAQAAASDARRAAGQARGPLDGVPVGLKDVIAVRGQPLTCGSRMLEKFVSPYDATVEVRRTA